MLRRCFLLLAALPCVFPALSISQALRADRTIAFKEGEADKHLLGDWPDIRLSPAESKRFQPFQGLRFTVTVSQHGDVVGVELENPEEPRPAGADEGFRIIRALHFRPFTDSGLPVAAQFPMNLPVFPSEKVPTTQVRFPEVNNPSSLVMTLERTTCYGTCPWYSIKVHGDGRVEYEGHCFVAERGSRTSAISSDAVNRLVEAFRSADYFSLDRDYSFSATDLPTYTTSIAFDGDSKSVSNYAGREVGMPDSVVAIENAIDREVNSAQWTSRNGHWRPKRREGCK